MSAKFSHVLPGLLFLMFAVALTATAQDEVQVPGPSTTNLFAPDPAIYDDKPLLMEGEKTKTTISILSDSLQHKVVPVPAAKKADSRKPQAEGDPLNFNFLYYIIQKFKASELMME